MRSGVGLCVLGLLCLHSSVFGMEIVQPGVLIFCDDPSVEKAAHSAVHKFNEGVTAGHKFALYQILSASKSENGADSVYSLQFTTRKSDCPVGTNRTWSDCEYLPSARKKPFPCNATVHMTETDADTKQVDCHIADHVVAEKAACMGCPEEIEHNSEDLKVPVSVSISKFNSISDSTHLFALYDVGHATRQVVAGFRYKIKFDMKKTTCAKAEHKELNELCLYDEENLEFVNCNSTVDVAPWRLEPPVAHINCEPGALPTTFSRRRPPGWSPLRNILYLPYVPLTAPPQLSPNSSSSSAAPPSPSKATTKDESSEEDTTATKPSSASPVNDDPFHCPSKPWKAFHPGQPVVTVDASSGTVAPQPTADGALSDSDLVG